MMMTEVEGSQLLTGRTRLLATVSNSIFPLHHDGNTTVYLWKICDLLLGVNDRYRVVFHGEI